MRNSTGSAFAAAAISSMNDSAAKVDCGPFGSRRLPVRSGVSHTRGRLTTCVAVRVLGMTYMSDGVAELPAAGVARVVMLSTDKAARPGGVMGATKRFAEYLMAARNNPGGSPKLVSVRFGNVLASRGSVVPLFIAQIRAGGPVTVSHEEATRYFMSLKEACMLVIQASLMGEGGEIFILRMGEPIRIAELARDLIALSGLKAGSDIRVEFTGLRPGEKLHEALVAEGEETVASGHEHILRTASRVPERAALDASLQTLEALAASGDDDGIRAELARVIADASLAGASAAEPKSVRRR